MNRIIVPHNYDYVGIFLTDRCHLQCSYCITKHHHAPFGKTPAAFLKPPEWIFALNRLKLPEGVPITLQGGEPFLYNGIWEILDNVKSKIDILTSLPPSVNKNDFLNLKTLSWNKRNAPYPRIRVSYHKGQNNYKELIEKIADLQDILSIGLFCLDHPSYSNDELHEMKKYAGKYRVEIRTKEFLGKWNSKQYGTYSYNDAVCGKALNTGVLCKNTVVPIAPDGTIYRCHSDLYFSRKKHSLGNILDNYFNFSNDYLYCDNYGLCSECDVKLKTNHLQIHGYTSVDIKFLNKLAAYDTQKTKSINY